jgi:hypothetical protein
MADEGLEDLAAWAEQTAAKLTEPDFSEPLAKAEEIVAEAVRHAWEAEASGQRSSGRQWELEAFVQSSGAEEAELVFATNNPQGLNIDAQAERKVAQVVADFVARQL